MSSYISVLFRLGYCFMAIHRGSPTARATDTQIDLRICEVITQLFPNRRRGRPGLFYQLSHVVNLAEEAT
jgi:hypothetical protein